MSCGSSVALVELLRQCPAELLACVQVKLCARGEAKVLRRQLRLKFGITLPDWAETRIDAASTAELERWTDSILHATCLEDVLGA
ncbi:MAG: hypothetical protein ACPGUV_02665 [Polyangiales bacterium]